MAIGTLICGVLHESVFHQMQSFFGSIFSFVLIINWVFFEMWQPSQTPVIVHHRHDIDYYYLDNVYDVQSLHKKLRYYIQ